MHLWAKCCFKKFAICVCVFGFARQSILDKLCSYAVCWWCSLFILENGVLLNDVALLVSSVALCDSASETVQNACCGGYVALRISIAEKHHTVCCLVLR